MSTPYHSKFFGFCLTRQCSAHDSQKLNRSIFNATVDLNPHQIDAALFSFRSPLSRGAILADEVGLGKTIEAGLVISQLWAERKRRILCIVPASLRQQWGMELAEKFFIDSVILESKNYNQFFAAGNLNPFEQSQKAVIVSYQFARSKAADILALPWDLVVLDEAHRLRNVYKKGNKIAKAILDAVHQRPKVLLTATPLQNSLMELYGLMSFVDPHVFGNEQSFRVLYVRRAGEMTQADFQSLRDRIRPICQRTLRRQVAEYIRYTNRVSITQDFTPTDDEVRLYEAVSSYLQRPESFALPSRQRSLMTLVLRKILASSSFAIAATLGSLLGRLDSIEAERRSDDDIPSQIAEDFESTDELGDEWPNDEGDDATPMSEDEATDSGNERKLLLKALRQEIGELKGYKELAESITSNAKGEALLVALQAGFARLSEYDAPRKALVFTESRRTQRYLYGLLEQHGYAGQIVMLNGTNTEPQSQNVYRAWLVEHQGQDCVSGSRSVDLRVALLDYFRNHASIMIATESGAEGLNLQFCSLVVNYDLPWNPQRIEQRIGRCHRYGQEHDVVVINFLNRRNAADKRVFELLSEKLQLFDGVFGTSDEVLGALESGVDFEKRINEIYQSCRTPDEINTAFDQLQCELEEQIRSRMADTRSKLLEHFDEEVHSRLRATRDETYERVSQYEEWLWALTRFELGDAATFDSNRYAFHLHRLPEGVTSENIPTGTYRLVTHRDGIEEHHYRLGQPLAEQLVSIAKNRPVVPKEVVFRYDLHDRKISVIEKLVGSSGWLRLYLVTIDALEREEHLVFAASSADGSVVDGDVCERLFAVVGEVGPDALAPVQAESELQRIGQDAVRNLTANIAQRNQEYFELEMEKLDNWAEDLKQQLEVELKELDKEIALVKREARQTPDLDQKIELHKKAKELEQKRTQKRRSLFDAQDEVDKRKEALISEIEARLRQTVEEKELFTIRWRVQ